MMAVNGTTAIPWRGGRHRRSTRGGLWPLEQLRACQEAWGPGAPWDRERAHAAICGTPEGSFLVVQDSARCVPSLLCVSTGRGDILDYHIQSSRKVPYSVTFSGYFMTHHFCRRVGLNKLHSLDYVTSQEQPAAFQLCDSCLSFPDLSQLVFFYSVTRDVLVVPLSIPQWIYLVGDNLSQLDPEAWLKPPSDESLDEMSHRELRPLTCSIQLTSANGALCIVNPLYIREHGDEWLSRGDGGGQSAAHGPARRLSTTRTWAGAGLLNKRAVSLEQEVTAASGESCGLTRVKSADSPQPSAAGVVLRRPSRDSAHCPLGGAGGSHLSPLSAAESVPPCAAAAEEPQPHAAAAPPQSPHRVSWIEDGVWLPPPRPSSLPPPPSLELDSLSISSMEEEPESQSPTPHHSLADKVLNRLSAVGQALGGLVCPKKRLSNRVQEMSERRGSAFAESVRAFVETTQRKGADPDGVTGSDYLQEVSSSLTALREALLDHAEIQALLDGITDLTDAQIDALVELSVHKVALAPVATHLYSCTRSCRINDGSTQQLQSNAHLLEKKEVAELGGSVGVGVPDADGLERIQHRWTMMHEAYSPNKKVHILLKVCKSIYDSMSSGSGSGTLFGADDFLPCLTWVLLRSDAVTIQVDTDYMMELLDPTQLQGEGGYYLTTLYASLYYISSFRPRLAARQLSVEAQHSLNQWHRRRTLHCNQSRRSKHRQTIRRQMCRDRLPLPPNADDNNTVRQEERAKEEERKEKLHPDEPQQQRDTSAESAQSRGQETPPQSQAQSASSRT